MLDVRLLGKFDVKRDGKPVKIPSRSAQSFFAYLILNAGTSHRREKLAGLFWPDSSEESARDYLRHALWKIRKAIESGASKAKSVSYIIADDLNVSFNAESQYLLDAALLGKINENAPADELISILSIYQGELLPGFYDEWVVLEREHLQSVFEHKMARLMALLQDDLRWLDILDWAERWIALGQKPEPAYFALMSAHAAKGDMSKVAATYKRCEKSLREFGIEPSEQTKELYENLKSGIEIPKALLQQAHAHQSISNIPTPLTSFIGREQELKDISRLLSVSQLLTLIGSGGVGKTRLAIKTAHDSVKKFKEGVYWVDLVGLREGALIPQEIAQALKVREVPHEPIIRTLTSSLKSKDLLLVLDNCEHLIEAAAQTSEQLLSACPKLKILATSRERLGIFNETTWHVPSLPLPEFDQILSLQEFKEFASVRLFVERAQNIKSDFELTDENVMLIAQICKRLDGIPLAIELAAARVTLLSLEEIAPRLDDRFSLLTSGSRTALPRQQTLRATIDWSHDLLTEPEKILFRRLSVFAGGFTLEAMEAVCSDGELQSGEVLDQLGHLEGKTLVVVDAGTVGGKTRYHSLETIREYAREKLEIAGEAEKVRDRHLGFFMKLAEEAELKLHTSEQRLWFDRLEIEIDNLRVAMVSSISGPYPGDSQSDSTRLEAGLRLSGALPYFWERRYQREAIDRIKQILSKSSMPTAGRARALGAIGFLYWSSLDHTEAQLYLVEASTIAKDLDDKLILGWCLGYLGVVVLAQGNYDSAKLYLEESLTVARKLGIAGRNAVGWALSFLADIPFAQGDYETARRLYEESATLMKESNDINTLTYPLRRLGYLALQEADYSQANEFFTESLRCNQEVGHLQGINRCVVAFACLHAKQGKNLLAVQLCGAVEGFLSSMSTSLFYSDKTEYDLILSKLRADVREQDFRKAWAKGLKMTLEQATQFALEES